MRKACVAWTQLSYPTAHGSHLCNASHEGQAMKNDFVLHLKGCFLFVFFSIPENNEPSMALLGGSRCWFF